MDIFHKLSGNNTQDQGNEVNQEVKVEIRNYTLTEILIFLKDFVRQEEKGADWLLQVFGT